MTISLNSIATEREFHSDKASTYWLSKDREKHDKMTGQHFCFKELLRGISVLDIECGSGVWLADMCSEYPNCIYHSRDIIDTFDIFQKIPLLKHSYGTVTQRLL
ncbi:hypothetical protein BY458DRAFT_446194 [Sporodiniella umbellata]|nr:hypothetical protein BY458DRAFT_446194 [Sporodiniella umbellata]